jgi:hypothetical protein
MKVVSAMRSRRARIVLAVLAGGLLVLAVGATISALSARRSLNEARASLLLAKDLLANGDTSGASAAFARAGEGFEDALDATEGAWIGTVGLVPFVGRTPDVVHAIAEAGARVAVAGSSLSWAVQDIGGVEAMAPDRGRIPLEQILRLAPSVGHAAQEVSAAVDALADAPRTLVIGSVSSARAEAEAELRSLDELLSTASALLDGLPSFLGRDGARRYFFGAQNPAELRGTGGVIGAYAILTVDDGMLSFSPFRPIQTLPDLSVDAVPSPSEEYSHNYDEFRGEDRFWLAINLTPDFPTAASAIVDAYEVATGERLDGVILADPLALEALMRITGPTLIPRLDVTLTADRVVAFTANEAYALLSEPEARKRLLGAVAESVVQRFLVSGEIDAGQLRSLARAAGAGHVLVYSEDPEFQSALESTGAGGALGWREEGDLLAVVENSTGGNKVDFFEDRAVDYEVWLRPDGSARGSVTVRLTNLAPISGFPKYVLGPYEGFSGAGESAQIVSLYCGPGCQLERAELDGVRVGVGAGTELGHPFYREDFRTASGATSELVLDWFLPSAWRGGSLGGVYRLSVFDQPTIRPDAFRLTVHFPEGMRVGDTSPVMISGPGTATWEGTLNGRTDLELEFGPSLLMRVWRILTPG